MNRFQVLLSKFNLRRYSPGEAALALWLVGQGSVTAFLCSLAPNVGRGLHSSTFRLNVSAFCGRGVHVGVVWGLCRGCLGGVRGY